jgi:hypothetical protein
MQQNAFAGQAKAPTEQALAMMLGQSLDLWRGLVDGLRQEWQLDQEWHSSSIKLGWSLRLQQKKRNIVYLSPRTGFFIAAFALGDRAVATAQGSDLPSHVKKLIATAKRYAEGTAVRIEVKSPNDLVIVKALGKIKIET